MCQHGPGCTQSSSILAAYAANYKGFKKTYPVQLQLASIVFKGKSIPKVAALVEAMARIKTIVEKGIYTEYSDARGEVT